MNQYTREEKIFTLIGILLALFLGAIDQTIVSTALPRIVEDLSGLDRYAWVATAYLVASTALVPIYGKLADMVSRKKIELAAVIIFLIGSFLCGIAGEWGSLPLIGDGMNQLIVFRAIQGIGGAGLFAMAFIVIADLFPPAERGKYQGFVGAVFGISSVLGPYIGGLLTDHATGWIPGVAGWRWVFYVNVPFGALALWFITTRMPPLRPHGERQPLNYLNAIFLIAGLGLLVMALQLDKNEYPWTSWQTLGLLAASLLSLGIFVNRCLHARNPILDLTLFQNRVFSRANIAVFLMGGVFINLIVFLPLFMVNVVGVSATEAGVSLIPLSLGLVAGSISSGQLVSRFGHYKWWMLGGGAILIFGLFLLSQMNKDVSYGTVTIYMLICGLGMGPSMPLYTLAIQNAVPMNKIGQATSASQFFRQIGGVVVVAVMGTVLATGLTSYFTAHMPAQMAGRQMGEGYSSPESRLESGGGAAVEDAIREGFARQYTLVERAVKEHDTAAINQLRKSPSVPPEMLARLEHGEVPPQALPGIKDQITERGEEVATQVGVVVKEGFTEAVTKIYFFAMFIALSGWLATLLIPELELRKTNGPIPAME